MDVDHLAFLVVEELAPELYEDEVYVWEIASVLRRIATDDSMVASVVRQAENEKEFIKKITVAAVRQILMLPGVETYFTGWPFDGDWAPHRSTMSRDSIIETVSMQLNRLGREPVALEIAFFRGVESPISQ